jgi:hypothetical protein
LSAVCSTYLSTDSAAELETDMSTISKTIWSANSDTLSQPLCAAESSTVCYSDGTTYKEADNATFFATFNATFNATNFLPNQSFRATLSSTEYSAVCNSECRTDGTPSSTADHATLQTALISSDQSFWSAFSSAECWTVVAAFL